MIESKSRLKNKDFDFVLKSLLAGGKIVYLFVCNCILLTLTALFVAQVLRECFRKLL